MASGDAIESQPDESGESSPQWSHIPALLKEVKLYLQPHAGQIFVDATVGLGGHAGALLAELGPTGRLIGLDRDWDALDIARKRLSRFENAVILVHRRFDELDLVLDELQIDRIDGVIADFGFSSMQIDRTERGFSFVQNGPVDMRMDRTQDITAGQILAQWSQEELGRLFFEFGDERWAKRIAARIVETRRRTPISSTTQLASIVSGAIPRKMWPKGIHPATKVFQALRIQVNEELDQIGPMIRSAVRRLRPGGRIACIAFHSLEDRIVKQVYRDLSGICTCPPRLPVCTCGAVKSVSIVTQRPVFCSDLEAAENYRARSARMRVAERV